MRARRINFNLRAGIRRRARQTGEPGADQFLDRRLAAQRLRGAGDGFKRVRILVERGAPAAWATRVALDATAAKVALVAANAPHEGLCDLEEAWVVRSLCRDHGLTQVEVGRALMRDKSWVCRRLMLAERLEAELQEQIRLGLLSSTVARELVRLPRGNQEPVMPAPCGRRGSPA